MARRIVMLMAIATLTLVSIASATAQDDYPNRPIKMVVPLPPGPTADAMPRIIAGKLAARWGHPVIVENRPGAAGNLAAEAVARATPDGYTLFATTPNPLVISQSFYSKLGFDPSAFVPVTVYAMQPYVLVVNPKVPALTLHELIEFAKANPDKLNYASAGTGSALHLTIEMLKAAAGIRLVHVPYQGVAPATVDLLAGRVDLMIDNLGNSLPLVREGKLRALGVASKDRIPELPDVPAIAEAFPGFFSIGWYAVVAPPKTPSGIANKLSQAIAETLKLPDVAKRFRDLSILPTGTSPAETAAFLKKETERWRKVIALAGIKPE
jgi:tripartite-type tricarboxylate transporter receptor subunit TctC